VTGGRRTECSYPGGDGAPSPHPAAVTPALACPTPAGVPGARRLLRAGLGHVFGPAPFDPTTDPGDPGLFGPTSASWLIIADAAAIIGGLRALLVQLLHPLAMAGVADHSQFRDDPLGRLQRTSAYVTGTTLGSTREALTLLHRVRSVHRKITGTTPDGHPYQADDPHLLAWISIALTSSFLATDRAYAHRPTTEATADRFVAEQSRLAALLDPRVDLATLSADPEVLAALRAGSLPLPMLEEDTLPQTVDQLHARLGDYHPELEVTEDARQALRFLSWPDIGPLIRTAYFPVLAGAVATLDTQQRQLLGLGFTHIASPALAAHARGSLTLFRVLLGASPSLHAATQRATSGDGNQVTNT
jgi:mpaB/rubber oxygenase-like protein